MIREFLKRNQYIVDIYKKLHLHYRQVLSTISPTVASKVIYKKNFNRTLNLDNPQDFNEKLMWLKLNFYRNNPLVTQCADKYKAREYVKQCGYEEILNDLIGVWDSVDQINWDELPDKFVIKCNHGAGYNIICDDKKKLDIDNAKTKLKKWMREDFWKKSAEINYKEISKKIICEKYISNGQGLFPIDYKIYCFNGEPLYIGCFIERDKETLEVKRGYFNFDWEPQDFLIDKFKYHNNKFPKPKNLEKMYTIAKDLCRPFPFVRVDFYECGDKIIFGELTFTPSACLATYFNEETQKKLGDLILLPK